MCISLLACLEVVGTRKNGRARRRHTRGEVAPSLLACLPRVGPFSLSPTNSTQATFSQAGMREDWKAFFELSFFIGLTFCRGTYPENYSLNIGLQELWHEMYYKLPPKWVKHKIKPQNTKIRYENTANWKGGINGQTWRLKRIIIVCFQKRFSMFDFVVCNVWYT